MLYETYLHEYNECTYVLVEYNLCTMKKDIRDGKGPHNSQVPLAFIGKCNIDYHKTKLTQDIPCIQVLLDTWINKHLFTTTLYNVHFGTSVIQLVLAY